MTSRTCMTSYTAWTQRHEITTRSGKHHGCEGEGRDGAWTYHTLVAPDILDAERGERSNKPYITHMSNLTAVHGSDYCPCEYILYNADPSIPRNARVQRVEDGSKKSRKLPYVSTRLSD